jgi:hypothetical protein
VERHRDYDIVNFIKRKRRGKYARQGISQRFDAAIFEEKNQVLQNAGVETVAVSAVETAQAISAYRAKPGFIQRECIREGRPATRAEMFGVQRFNAAQAALTNRNAADFEESLITDPAVFREKKRKKAVGDLTAKGEEGRWDDTLTKGRYTATREGAPPRVVVLGPVIITKPCINRPKIRV